jgi:hypothetical protein
MVRSDHCAQLHRSGFVQRVAAQLPFARELESAMKKFLAIYLGTPPKREDWLLLPEAQRKEREQAGMKAWMDWGKANAAAIVDQGAPLGKTKRAAAQGIDDVKNLMTGYVIVQAESHEAAAKMFDKHPHFSVFPGDAVEIMECLPMPTMK